MESFLMMVGAATTNHFEDFAQRFDLRVRSRGVDRHGSFVWEAIGEFGGLHRSITLALTPQTPDPQSAVTVECQYGANDGERYQRGAIVVGTLANPDQLLRALHDGKVVKKLTEALSRARQLTPADLEREFVAPHRSP